MYLYTADKETGQVSGFYVSQGNDERDRLAARPIWQLNLGGTGNAHKIINIAIKNPIEHVHSQGRVFNDRSVLYKYINPNLVVIATLGPDAVHKSISMFNLFICKLLTLKKCSLSRFKCAHD